MCGRFMLDSDVENLIRQYKILKGEVDDYKKGDIYPSQNVPIVMVDDERTLKSAKWGFPIRGKGNLIINARSESIAEKPMFKNSFHNARCIIPVNLFYEWKDEGDKKKAKHNIYLDQKITSLAGIYEIISNDKGEKQLSFVIITTAANRQMNEIHSRMPLIIENNALDLWLDKDTSSKIIKEIIKLNLDHKLQIDRNNEDKPFEQMRLF